MMEFDPPTWLIVSSLLVSTLVIYLFNDLIGAAFKRRAPGPVRLPIVGNLLSLDGNLHSTLARLAKIHGPVMSLKLGAAEAVVVTSPEGAKEVLQTYDSAISDRCTFDVNHIMGHADASVVFLSPNQVWKQMRAILATNLFSTKCIEANRFIRQQKMRELVAYFRAEAGRPVQFGQAAYVTVLNILSNVVFSRDLGDLNSESEFGDLVITINKELASPNVSDFFPMLKTFDLQRKRRNFTPLVIRLYGIMDELVDDRLRSKMAQASESSDGDFLDRLIQLLNEDKLDRKAIRVLLSDLFIAGTDTSSITLTWAMSELLLNPAVMAKVRAELEDAIGSRTEVEESDVVGKLPYLHAVVKEVLRLHPPAPLLIPHKVAEEGVKLGGYPVPKGAQVLVNVWAIGRDERIWPEPELFRPERFLEKEIEFKSRGFELVTFGAGRRACPGMPMAHRVLHFTLATLLYSFEWRLADGMKAEDLDMRDRFGISLNMAVPLKIVASPIERKTPPASN